VEANGSSKFQAPKELPHACSIKMDSFEPNAAESGSYKKCYLIRTNKWKLIHPTPKKNEKTRTMNLKIKVTTHVKHYRAVIS
jgi:hypothetical protein